jgi:TolB protein
MTGGAVLGLALAGCAAGQGPAAVQSPAQQSPAQQTAAPQATVSGAASAAASAETSAARGVPWPSVGPGWVLDTYSTGTAAKPAPTILYLASPAGAKYALLSWPTPATTPTLMAWAGDKTEALFGLDSASGMPDGYGELDLMTGRMTRVAFADTATLPLGYTRPDGQQILGVTQHGSGYTIARYTPAGALVQALVTGPDAADAVYSPDGTALAVPAPGGLQLVSNAGGVLRNLPVPGVTAKSSCGPVRWWDATTILAGCQGLGLWLVPSGGAKPTELTPVRKASFDYGDIDAWQLPSGLYLQSLGACGALELNKQASDGSVTAVAVPGLMHTPVVVTASGPRLLIKAHDCQGGDELVWYNPGTGAEQWIFTAGAGSGAVAYNDPDNGGIG